MDLNKDVQEIIQLEGLLHISSEIKETEFVVSEYKNVIKKSYSLYMDENVCNNENVGISQIILKGIPEYLHYITLSFGKKTFFVWNKDELKIYNFKNLLDKYKIKTPIPIMKSYDQVFINFIYDAEEIYKKFKVETKETTYQVASEDLTKVVEYWDSDEECVCKAFGVKYETVKETKNILQENIKLKSSRLKLEYKPCKINDNEDYKVSFYDEMIKNENNLIFKNKNVFEIEYN